MIMDMPVIHSGSVMETVRGWSTDGVVQDMSHVVKVLKETWDLQTFTNLEQGKVAVSDEVINQSLALAIEGSEAVQKLEIASLEDHKLKVTALTRKAGRVIFLCRVEQFEHTKDHSLVKLKIIDKKLPDKPLVSWIFSKVSLAMAAKLVGNVNAEGLGVKIVGNEVTVDFHQALCDSPMGALTIWGYKPLEAVTIKEAVPENGFVSFTTAVDLPDNLKSMVQNVLP